MDHCFEVWGKTNLGAGLPYPGYNQEINQKISLLKHLPTQPSVQSAFEICADWQRFALSFFLAQNQTWDFGANVNEDISSAHLGASSQPSWECLSDKPIVKNVGMWWRHFISSRQQRNCFWLRATYLWLAATLIHRPKLKWPAQSWRNGRKQCQDVWSSDGVAAFIAEKAKLKQLFVGSKL